MYNHSVEEVNSTRRKFRISIEKKAIATAFQKALGQVQASAEIRGFRKGKAPEALIKKFYANEVVKKAYEQVVEDSYQQSIKAVDFQIVSYPMIEPEGQFTESSEFNYTATVDINPKVEITGYKELSLKQVGPDGDIEAQTEQALKQLTRDNSTFTADGTGRAAAKDDFLTFDCTLKLDGKVLESQSRTGTRIQLDGTNFADLEAGLLGMKAGETKTFTVNFPATYRDEEVAGKSVEFTATLKTIDNLNAPALDDEFAKKFGVENVEELRRNVRNSLANLNEKNRINQFRDQIISQILEKNSFEVPESLVEGTVDRAISEANSQLDKKSQLDGTKEDVRAGYREWALKEVRGVLALGHIARTEGLTVDDKEVSAEMAVFALQTGTRVQDIFRQYGSPIIEEFRGKVLIDKVLKHLIGLNNIEISQAEAKAEG
jgi:trigger factor